METITDITIRLNSAVNRLEWRKENPKQFPGDNHDLIIEILEIQNELNTALKIITK